jgi:hypothetical protein
MLPDGSRLHVVIPDIACSVRDDACLEVRTPSDVAARTSDGPGTPQGRLVWGAGGTTPWPFFWHCPGCFDSGLSTGGGGCF